MKPNYFVPMDEEEADKREDFKDIDEEIKDAQKTSEPDIQNINDMKEKPSIEELIYRLDHPIVKDMTPQEKQDEINQEALKKQWVKNMKYKLALDMGDEPPQELEAHRRHKAKIDAYTEMRIKEDMKTLSEDMLTPFNYDVPTYVNQDIDRNVYTNTEDYGDGSSGENQVVPTEEEETKVINATAGETKAEINRLKKLRSIFIKAHESMISENLIQSADGVKHSISKMDLDISELESQLMNIKGDFDEEENKKKKKKEKKEEDEDPDEDEEENDKGKPKRDGSGKGTRENYNRGKCNDEDLIPEVKMVADNVYELETGERYLIDDMGNVFELKYNSED